MNADESGVDCGGSCLSVCRGEYMNIGKKICLYFSNQEMVCMISWPHLKITIDI